jgi:hypothetical protein
MNHNKTHTKKHITTLKEKEYKHAHAPTTFKTQYNINIQQYGSILPVNWHNHEPYHCWDNFGPVKRMKQTTEQNKRRKNKINKWTEQTEKECNLMNLQRIRTNGKKSVNMLEHQHCWRCTAIPSPNNMGQSYLWHRWSNHSLINNSIIEHGKKCNLEIQPCDIASLTDPESNDRGKNDDMTGVAGRHGAMVAGVVQWFNSIK